MTILLILAVCFLAGSNGSNDNRNGVTSLLGSKFTRYRTDMSWANVPIDGTQADLLLSKEFVMGCEGGWSSGARPARS